MRVALLWLVAAVTVDLGACVTASSYTGADLAGSTVELSRSNAAPGLPISVTVYSARADGLAIPGLIIQPTTSLCVFNPASALSDARGEATFTLTCGSIGQRVVTTKIAFSDFSATLVPRPRLNVYVPADGNTLVAPGTKLSLQAVRPTVAGRPDRTYRGTVRFVSSDPLAQLPAPYTFTSADFGVHQLVDSIVLSSPGLQSVSAVDTATGALLAQESFTVGAAPNHDSLASLQLRSVPDTVVAGIPITLGAAALGMDAQVFTGYIGVVHVECSDAQATLPSTLVFTPADQGSKTAPSPLIFRTSGDATISIRDETTGLRLVKHVYVTPSPVVGFSLVTFAGAPVLEPLGITATAVDAFGNQATEYTGIVHFSCAAPGCSVPPDYTFMGSDQGRATPVAPLLIPTTGSWTLRVQDAAIPSLKGLASTRAFATPIHPYSDVDVCLDGGFPGASLGVTPCTADAAQQWQLKDGVIRSTDGRCVDTQTTTYSDNLVIYTSPCDPNATTQRFSYDPNTLHFFLSDASSWCLDLAYGVYIGGQPILHGCYTTGHQEWLLDKPSRIAAMIGPATCLDAASAPGSVLTSAPCSQARSWLLNNSQVQAAGTFLCAAVTTSPYNAQSPVRVLPCDASAPQQWTYQGATKQLQKSDAPQFCLSMSQDPNANAVLMPCVSSQDPNWRTQAWMRDAHPILLDADPNWCLDAAGGKNVAGVGLALAPCDGRASQNWSLINSQLATFGNFCATVSSDNSYIGDPPTLHPCASSSTLQMWSYDPISQLILDHSAQHVARDDYALDLNGASPAAGTPVVIGAGTKWRY